MDNTYSTGIKAIAKIEKKHIDLTMLTKPCSKLLMSKTTIRDFLKLLACGIQTIRLQHKVSV